MNVMFSYGTESVSYIEKEECVPIGSELISAVLVTNRVFAYRARARVWEETIAL